jgi:hypothetical protein
MNAIQCSCGFVELPDELMTDHLQRVFAPDDGMGKDGQVHVETSLLACSCGLSAVAGEALDRHFLEAFTPADAIGSDGRRHEIRTAT